MSQHTPGRLKVIEGINLQSDPLGGLAYVSVAGARGRTFDEAKANAHRLALCWNLHDELVFALACMVTACEANGYFRDKPILTESRDLIGRADPLALPPHNPTK